MTLSKVYGTRRRGLVAVGSAMAMVAMLAACSSGKSKAESTPTTGGGSTTPPSSQPSSSGSGGAAATGCDAYKQYTGHSGTTVTMFGSILSPESDSLNKSWAQFQQCTGITIKYTGSNDFESQLPVQVQGGTPPDLAIIPQPGLLQQMVKTGAVKKPPQAVADNVDKYWNKAWKQYGSVDGVFYAAPQSANLKSLVWYSPKAFAAAGYTVPTTWADMMKLSDTIAASGKGNAWCGGIGSGTATGWPATDWLEEVVLGKYGGDVYDKWVSHEIKFSDPQIIDAMNIVKNWMLNPKYVGDVKAIASTTFQDAGKGIPTGKCWMLQQASFYEAQWASIDKNLKVGPDGDVFAFKLPPVDPSVTKDEVEGGGEFTAAFSDRPEVQAVQTYLSSPEWASSRVKVAPGWVSANSGVDQSLYTDPIDQISAKYLTDESATFRFDASDLMPAAIGSGEEWKQMTAWFAEGKSVDAVAKAIDAAWPS